MFDDCDVALPDMVHALVGGTAGVDEVAAM
jgi:hypothetical protein